MKRTLIISFLVAAMGVIAFVSCEKEGIIENSTITAVASQITETTATNPQGGTMPVTHNTELSYSGCHSGQRDGYEPIVSINYGNGILLLTIENFRVNCAMDSIFSELTVDNQTIDLNLKENSYAANCICPVDVNYSINNIKEGTYELIVRHADIIEYQEEITCE